MLNKIYASLSMIALMLAVMVSESVAQVFPVDGTSTTTIANVKADLIAWGVVFIGVALTVFAYKRVKSLVR